MGEEYYKVYFERALGNEIIKGEFYLIVNGGEVVKKISSRDWSIIIKKISKAGFLEESIEN